MFTATSNSVLYIQKQYKTVNLVLTTLLNLLGGMLSVNGRSHMMRHVIILRLFGTPKSYIFRETLKGCAIDSIP